MSLDPNIGQDPTAGAEAGYQEPQVGDEGTQPPEQPAERTYTETQWNSEFARARRAWEYESQRQIERAVQQAREEFARQQQQPQQQTQERGFDPTVESALKAWLDRQLAPVIGPFQEGQVRSEVKQGLADFSMRHPELSMDEVNDVLDTALSFGEDVVNKAPIEWLLDTAFTQRRFGDFDEEKFRQQAVDDYLKGKSQARANTPRPQTGGGALTGQKRAKDFKTADEQFENMLREAENT